MDLQAFEYILVTTPNTNIDILHNSEQEGYDEPTDDTHSSPDI